MVDAWLTEDSEEDHEALDMDEAVVKKEDIVEEEEEEEVNDDEIDENDIGWINEEGQESGM